MSNNKAAFSGVVPAVDRILYIPEILDDIVQYLNHPALARAARVCLSLHDTSIRRLWSGLLLLYKMRDIDKSVNILKHLRDLIPPDLAETHLTKDGWSRFKHYSGHVKGIYIDTVDCFPELYLTLGDSISDLFPNLQKPFFSWRILSNNSGLDYTVLAGHQLQAMGFVGKASSYDFHDVDPCFPVIDRICQQILIRCPGIEELNFHGPKGGSPKLGNAVVTSVAASVHSMNNLRSLSWRWLPAPLPQLLLHTLSTLPQLSRLWTEKIPSIDRKEGPLFPALQHLHLRGVSESWLTSLANFPGLTHLHVLTHTWRSSSSFGPLNITNLNIGTGLISWQDFPPLLSCKYLKTCKIHAPKTVGFNQATLEKMASSWRELTDLSLALGRAPVTILGLAPFAATCAKLRRFCLLAGVGKCCVGGRSWEEAHRLVMGQTYPARPMEDLYLELQPLGDESEQLGWVDVGLLLRKIWPSLDPSNFRLEYEGDGALETIRAAMKGIRLL